MLRGENNIIVDWVKYEKKNEYQGSLYEIYKIMLLNR